MRCWIVVDTIDPYLGEAAQRRASSHGGSHSLLSRPAISNLCLAFSLRYSDTQTHQLAARKEKPMENLKNALGIVHEDDLKEYLPGSNDAKIDDGDKAGNTKETDHGFDGAGKDGLNQLKQYKKKTEKKRVFFK
ncbi:hypothetical protein Tco_0246128 [Tanacetum coccineum]